MKTIFIVFAVVLLAAVFAQAKEKHSDSKEKHSGSKEKPARTKLKHHSSEESLESLEELKEISKQQRKSNGKKKGSNDKQKDNPSSQQVERGESQGESGGQQEGADWTGDQQGNLLGARISQKDERGSKEGSVRSDTQQKGGEASERYASPQGAPNPHEITQEVLNHQKNFYRTPGTLGQHVGFGFPLGRSSPLGVPLPYGQYELPGNLLGTPAPARTGLNEDPIPKEGPIGTTNGQPLGGEVAARSADVGIKEGGGSQERSVGTDSQQGGGAANGGASNPEEVRVTQEQSDRTARGQQVGSSIVQGQLGLSGSLLGGPVGVLGETSRLVGARVDIKGGGPREGSVGTDAQQGGGAANGRPATPQGASNSQEVRGTQQSDGPASARDQQVRSSVVQGQLGVSDSLLSAPVGILGETSRLVGARVGIKEEGGLREGSIGTYNQQGGTPANGRPGTPQSANNPQEVGETSRLLGTHVGIKEEYGARDVYVGTVGQQRGGAASGRSATPQGARNPQEDRDTQVNHNPQGESVGLPGPREEVGPNVVLGSQDRFGITGGPPARSVGLNRETRWPLEAHFDLQGDRGLKRGLERIDAQQVEHHLQGVHGSQWERGSLQGSRGLQGRTGRLQEEHGAQGHDGAIGYLEGTRVSQEESGRPLGFRGQEEHGVLLGRQGSYRIPDNLPNVRVGLNEETGRSLEARFGEQRGRGLQREPEGLNVQQEGHYSQWERSSLLDARSLQGGYGHEERDAQGRGGAIRNVGGLQGTRIPQERLVISVGGCQQQGAYGSQGERENLLQSRGGLQGESNRLQGARLGVQEERGISEKTLGVLHLDIVFCGHCQ